MAYTINLTNGTIYAVIADGTINTTSSLTLVGKNYAGYGQFLDENFIKLLESGANSTAPGAPLTGQLWFDTSTKLLKVYNGTTFKTISASTASASAPTSNVQGDLWFDTANAQLKVFDGTTWVLIGPSFTAGTGTSGAVVDTITDSSPGADHVIVKLFVNNTIVAIFSKDATFTPASPITGFSTIGPGINLSSTVSNAVFKGTATNAALLNNLASTDFMRATGNATSTVGTLSVLNDNGAYVGVNSDLRLLTGSTNAYIRNQTPGGNVYLQITPTGNAATPTSIVSINGATGNTAITGNLIVSGSITNGAGGGGTVLGDVSVTSITNSGGNGIGNIGSSTSYFNTVFAKATSAQYADLAERFHADTAYPAGTVVELGGVAEITRAVEELSDNVFGVISTQAAYLMNGMAGDDSTHPPIAMTGRVPVLTVGTVRKGDRLVSAGNGLARAAKRSEITAFNVIGRALEDKLTDGEGTVEAIVTIN